MNDRGPMFQPITRIRRSLFAKLTIIVGATLLASMAIWAYFNIDYSQKRMMEEVIANTDRLTNTIRLGTHYAMMLNSRDDITQIIQNIGKQSGIEHIRIYNKSGQIKFSNRSEEVNTYTNIKAEACDICHHTDPPYVDLSLPERTRILQGREGRLLGIITPICNEMGCSTDACHVHPEGKRILGALDVVVSLGSTDIEMNHYKIGILLLSFFLFFVTSALIFLFMRTFVSRPIDTLIRGARAIGMGSYDHPIEVRQPDEMGLLAEAIAWMRDEIAKQQRELNKQRDEYQNLFELVPCLITVQDRDFRLIRCNREFLERFSARIGDFCYWAYKGRDRICDPCPVKRTFEDGKPHYGEESRENPDGTVTHWVARTSPVKNEAGEIVAVMEVCLDITRRKQLEESLDRSEKKYHAIFNNIPNPVFVLEMERLTILDCNHSVTAMYGYSPEELKQRSFLDLFSERDRMIYGQGFSDAAVLNKVQQIHRSGRILFADIWLRPCEYPGRQVLLVTTSDITERLETEQQFLQASKMATLGEMATGVAHELNQPLSVIKTAASFLIKKTSRNEPLEPETLGNMLQKIDTNVDRATRIIVHMRQFARKSEACLDRVRIVEVIERAVDIFSQQLKVRGIELVWDVEPDLPCVVGDPGRLEQVFINLLLNARDAIEAKGAGKETSSEGRRIVIGVKRNGNYVCVEIADTGIGIPKAIQEKIFEPFFTTKEVGKGTGLGLSISYGIVKECGGSIQVRSVEGQGATFILCFPVRENDDETIGLAGR